MQTNDKRRQPAAKRQRGRGRKPGGQQNHRRSFDSNGPSVKIRGSASQISEKYQALARDANLSGDRIAAENFLQHAEHYYRLVRAAQVNAAQNSHSHANAGSADQSQQPSEAAEQNSQPSAPQTQSVTPHESLEKSGQSVTEAGAETNEAPPKSPRTRRRRPAESGQANGKSAAQEDESASAPSSKEPGAEPQVSDEVPA